MKQRIRVSRDNKVVNERSFGGICGTCSKRMKCNSEYRYPSCYVSEVTGAKE